MRHEKSVPAARRPARQRGAALLIFMLVLVMGALTYLVSSLSSGEIEARRAQKTQQALSQAREALIGYALRYREDQIADGQYDRVHGHLPLPDLGTVRNNNAGCVNEGCDAANFSGNALNTTVVGRLPWRTLGIEPLRDGHGECLWYAVSGSHQSQQRVSPMNWDTLGHLDVVVANGGAALASILATAHDRPVAVIFSPGPPLPGQDRADLGGNVVTQCGGNYDAANYLDPATAGTLGIVTNYLAGSTNNASGVTGDADPANDPDTPKALSTQGKVFVAGSNLLPNGCPQGSDCALAANDAGRAVTSDDLFGAIRKSAFFRTDINSMLDRITDCLRDQGVPSDYAKIAGADNDSCYGKDLPPRGYYPHYKEMIFVAGDPTTKQVNGVNCAGALLFSNQRRTGQLRVTNAQKDNPPSSYDNYLEGINRNSFTALDTVFSGQEIFERVSANQTAHQDIVRCIPAGTLPSFVTTQSPGLEAADFPQLASYSSITRTLTLGQQVHTTLSSSLANFLYGCAWRPETRQMGGGLRTYFTFSIDDARIYTTVPIEGFTFAIVDGDNNGTNACGAAGQHLGYSGNNTETPFIAQPKIAFEVDPRREGAVFPSATNPNRLTNGRNDPLADSANYRGGHVALVYWGGETPISAPAISPCVAPAYLSGGICTLPQEEDDNVHGQAAPARTGFPVPPPNPAAPVPRLTVPPDTPAGVYKLDPDTASVPVNTPENPKLFHVRVELTRAPSSYNLPRVRVATTGEINLSAPGTIDANDIHLFQVDGVYLFPGDRVLVKNQSDPKQNGIYVWEGVDKTMKRAGDANTVEALAGLIVEVMQGVAHAGQLWRQQTVQPTTCADPNIKPVDCTVFDWQPASVAEYGNLPSASTQTGRIVYVQKGDQANGWFRSVTGDWQRVWAELSTQEAINLASAPATIDGIAPAAGSRILVRHQANAAENGVFLWNGEGSTMSRVSGFDSGPVLAGALVQVLSGSDAGRAFRQTAMPYGGTVGTNAIQWEAIDASPHYLLEAWLLLHSPSYSQRIAAMQDTTRPMSFLIGLLDPPQTFPPHLRDTPVIPYPFRKARLGFTIGQRTSVNDQTVTIGNFFTTWLP